LYIEDDLANIRMMQDLMKHFKGISLICAEDPVSGLELANTIKPDLILLDIQMPIMDGFEVLKLLKAGKKTEAVPVVAVSADAVRVSVEQAKEAGFSDYITKPIDIEQLMKAIGRLVSTA
jgi:CheY-like chemotaxis protein